MDLPFSSLPGLGAVLLLVIGLSLVLLLVLSSFSRAQTESADGDRHLDVLLRDIRRGIRKLSSPARAGGFFYRETQEEVGRLLSELQGRLHLLDDPARQRYEARAGQVLADAARAGITVPPLESPWFAAPFPG